MNRNIKGKDSSLQVYTTSDNKINSKEFISLTGITELKSSNRIPINDQLIIDKFDLINDASAINQIEYNIYDTTGKKLDLSMFQEVKGIIAYPIKDNYLDIDKLKYLFR